MVPLLEKNQEKAVGQNLKFDIPILARHGIKITKFHADTMLMSYVLNSTATRHSMDRMAEYYLQLSTIKYTIQSSLGIRYNTLNGFIDSVKKGIKTPYKNFTNLGLYDDGGNRQQISDGIS